MDASRVADLSRELAGKFYFSEELMRLAVRDARSFNVIHLGRFHKIDVFVP